MTLKDLEKILYFECYVVIEPDKKEFPNLLSRSSIKEVLTEHRYREAMDEHGPDSFFVPRWARRQFAKLLAEIDIEALSRGAARPRDRDGDRERARKRKKIAKRLKVVNAFRDVTGNRP